MGIALDRIAIEEVGANSTRLAEAIHLQLGEVTGPVPVEAIARALDIVEIRVEMLENFEGALVTRPERSHGSILLNKRSSTQRRRFTLGHELCHFLNPWHVPTTPEGFRCRKSDMIAADQRSTDLHWRQESEANAFAIELLTPRRRLRPYLGGDADLSQVLAITRAFDISREAATRRYVSLHEELLAAIFSHNGRVVYAEYANGFPRLGLRKSDPVPTLPAPSRDTPLSDIEEADADDWLLAPVGVELSVQTLHQAGGRATTLLCVLSGGPDERDEIDDAYQHFTRFGEDR